MWILIKLSLKLFHKVRINDIPALVLIMAWRRPGTSHYLNQWWLDYRRIYVSLGLNELRFPWITTISRFESCVVAYGRKHLFCVVHTHLLWVFFSLGHCCHDSIPFFVLVLEIHSVLRFLEPYLMRAECKGSRNELYSIKLCIKLNIFPDEIRVGSWQYHLRLHWL